MSIIFRPAFLNVCGCGKHAQIMFCDGTSSERFFSKEIGFYLISRALDSGKITVEESTYLNDAISSLQKMAFLEEEVELDDLIGFFIAELIAEKIASDLCDLENKTTQNHYIN